MCQEVCCSHILEVDASSQVDWCVFVDIDEYDASRQVGCSGGFCWIFWMKAMLHVKMLIDVVVVVVFPQEENLDVIKALCQSCCRQFCRKILGTDEKSVGICPC